MAALAPEEFESIAELLNGAKPDGPFLINGYIKAARKYSPLLKTANAKAIAISKDSKEFKTTQPVFVGNIDFLCEAPKKFDEGLSITVSKLDGTTENLAGKVLNFKATDGTSIPAVRYRVDQVIASVTVKSKLTYRTIKATKVRVYGFTLEQLDSIAERVGKTLDLKTRLTQFVDEQESRVEEARTSLGSLELQVADLTGQHDEILREKDEAVEGLATLAKELEVQRNAKNLVDATLDESRSKLEAAENNQTQLAETVAGLNREIAKKKSELGQLVNDRNLISDEYRDYVAEGGQQSRLYASFLFLSISVIAFASWQLYRGALRIHEAELGTLQELMTLALQRLPLAAALALVVAVAWKLGAIFVERIMTIHSQRLALARLLVIAKDTVYASASGLEVSDELRFRERIRLKLAMLKAHLTSELGSDFEYASEEPAQSPKAAVEEELARAAATADEQ